MVLSPREWCKLSSAGPFLPLEDRPVGVSKLRSDYGREFFNVPRDGQVRAVDVAQGQFGRGGQGGAAGDVVDTHLTAGNLSQGVIAAKVS